MAGSFAQSLVLSVNLGAGYPWQQALEAAVGLIEFYMKKKILSNSNAPFLLVFLQIVGIFTEVVFLIYY